jgi:hypothetical protein
VNFPKGAERNFMGRGVRLRLRAREELLESEKCESVDLFIEIARTAKLRSDWRKQDEKLRKIHVERGGSSFHRMDTLFYPQLLQRTNYITTQNGEPTL